MTPIEWLLGSDTGVSSKTILAAMTGSEMKGTFGPDIPYDPSDFGRCYRLLNEFPEWRMRFEVVATVYPFWKPFVDVWQELEHLYEEEVVNCSGTRAPKLYQRMKPLVEEAREIRYGRKENAVC